MWSFVIVLENSQWIANPFRITPCYPRRLIYIAKFLSFSTTLICIILPQKAFFRSLHANVLIRWNTSLTTDFCRMLSASRYHHPFIAALTMFFNFPPSEFIKIHILSMNGGAFVDPITELSRLSIADGMTCTPFRARIIFYQKLIFRPLRDIRVEN